MPLLTFRSLREAANVPIEVDLPLLEVPVVTFAPGAEVSLSLPIIGIPVTGLDPEIVARFDLDILNIPLQPIAPSLLSAADLELLAVATSALAPALEVALNLPLQNVPILPLDFQALAPIEVDLSLVEVLVYAPEVTAEITALPGIVAGRSRHRVIQARIEVALPLLEIRVTPNDPRLQAAMPAPLELDAPAITVAVLELTVGFDWTPVRIREEDEALLLEEDLLGVGI